MEHSDDLLRAGGAIPFIFDSEQKEKRSKKFLNTQGPALLKPFENKLESTQTGYLVGASLTAADVFFAVVIDHHYSIFRVSMLEELPLCKKLYLKVKTEPSIAMWQKSNPPKSPVELLEEVSSFNSKL
jgi:glutathione S-transferase